MRGSAVKNFLYVSVIGFFGLVGVEILLNISVLSWNPIVYWAYGIFFGWITLGAIPSIVRIWNGRTEESNVLSIIYDWDSGLYKGVFIGKNNMIDGEYGETPDEAKDLLLAKLEHIGRY